MKSFALLLWIVFFTCLSAQSQGKRIPVFVSGTEGHTTYRIPALIPLPNGDILAFCEGRVHGGNDFGDINIVMKRSSDNGNTWSDLQTIVDYDTLQAGNPAPVIDLTDPQYPNGRIFLFYNTGNRPEGEVRKGNGLREVWYVTSADNGKTWSKAVNITLQVHRPLQPRLNEKYKFLEDWRSFANTPGHALQINSGTNKGRIYVAANHSAGKPLPGYADGRAFGYYTDDHGASFQQAEDIPVPGSNEATAAALSGNRLMINCRNQQGNIKKRIVAISSDGGQHWDTTYFDDHLPDPVCEGSLLNMGTRKGKNILAFCNNADTLQRNHLTLRISDDDGKSWKHAMVIDENPAAGKNNDYTAYADIARLGSNSIAVLYERNNYSEIVFTIVQWR